MASSESIESILNWFSFDATDKDRLRSMLNNKEPRTMGALANFIKTKDTNALRIEFEQVLRNESYVPQVSGEISSLISPSHAVTARLETHPSTHASGSFSSTAHLYGAGTGITTVGYAPYHPSTGSYSTTLPPYTSGSYSSVTPVKVSQVNLGTTSGSYTQKVETKAPPATTYNQSQSSQWASNDKDNQFAELKAQLHKEYTPGEGFSSTIKEKLRAFSKGLTFKDFLQIRFNLGLDKVNVKDLAFKIREYIMKLFPPTKHKSGTRYNPGLSLEEFVDVMGGGINNPLESIFNIILAFYYLDFNDNGLLEMDEIIQGFISMSTGSEKEKIEASFIACDEDGNGILDQNELISYLRVIIRAAEGKDGNRKPGQSQNDYELEIELAAKALAESIFNDIDLDGDGTISCEEFIIWHNALEHAQRGGGDSAQQKELMREALAAAAANKKAVLEEMECPSNSAAGKEKLLAKYQDLTSQLDKGNQLTEEIRVKYHFDKVSMTHFVNTMKELQTTANLSMAQFREFIEVLLKDVGVQFHQKEFAIVCKELFNIFDRDGNGVLDWEEILAGCQYFVVGSHKEKIRCLFQIFDRNGDGVLQIKELFYLLKASYKTLYQDSSMKEATSMSYDELAFAAAVKAFKDLGIDKEKGGMDYTVFEGWMKESNLAF